MEYCHERVNAEQGSNCLRTLNEVELDSVSGGEIKASANLGYFGQILWLDNGCAQYMTHRPGAGSCSDILDVYVQC